MIENATVSPSPRYPYEARKWHMTGNGLYLLRVDIETGKVKKVTVAKSTGHDILDREVIFALERWQFQPGKLHPIRQLLPNVNDPHRDSDSILKVPVRFTLGTH
jgi:TonB family protein